MSAEIRMLNKELEVNSERGKETDNGLVMENLSDHLVDGFKGGQGIVRERDLGNREESSALPSDRSFWEAESVVCQKMYQEQGNLQVGV